MIQEPAIQPTPSSPDNDENEQTMPRIPALGARTSPTECTLQVRCSKAFAVSIDQQGAVNLHIPGQDALILGPEEAFDLLDFLYAHRNLLASRSADMAEQQAEMHRNSSKSPEAH